MSKKDYQAIARALFENAPGFLTPAEREADGNHAETPQYAMWRKIVRGLADVLQADNPRFARARFIEACETGRCKGMPKRRAS